ncbi:MAG: integrin alpha, partial [Bacteroidales bacterium]|nr:integrin alpha [Bacteroidales bacterium]
MEDIIVGAYFADPLGRSGAGIVYVFLGNNSFPQQNLVNLSVDKADIIFFGAINNSQLGKSLAIGNINNDAYDDIIIAAPSHAESGIDYRGAVYIIYGSASLTGEYDLSSGGFDCKFLGAQRDDQLGLSLLSSDLNNDNYDDIIIGAPYADQSTRSNCGKVYVFWGGTSVPSQIDLSSQGADLLIIGELTNDRAGTSLSSGNVNGGNCTDLIIGAPIASTDPIILPSAGKIYIIEGRAAFPSSEINLSNATEVSTRIYGADSFAKIGNVTASGDVNGDGYDDILLTDFAAQNNRGAVKIIYGNTTLPTQIDLGVTSPNVIIIGGNYKGILGAQLFSSGFNDDIFDDIIIGVPGADTDNGYSSGLVHLILGNNAFTDTLQLDSDLSNEIYFGAASDDIFGGAITTLNFNNDDKIDVCIGASTGSNNSGQIYTVFGGLPYILNKYPYNKSVDVQVDATVTFELWDDDEGVNLNSISVVIGGVSYNSSHPNFSYTGDPAKYNIAIVPIEPFGYDQIVDVMINCEDNGAWKMPPESYYFTTEQ